MKKILTLTATIIMLFFSQGSFATIYSTTAAGYPGPLTSCLGNTTTLFDSVITLSTGGTWSSSNPAVATVGLTTGFLTSLSAGTTMITYTGTSGVSTGVFTVYPLPGPLTGASSPICVGGTATLSTSSPGGGWINSSPSVASVDLLTSVVTGLSAGTTAITYVIADCSTSTVVTVSSAVAPVLSGPTTLCTGTTISLSSTVSGGTWLSTTSAVATVTASGVVTGHSVGTTTISYTTASACGGSTATHTVTVYPTPSAIGGGTSPVCAGGTTTLTNSVSGGTWSSSSPTVGTINTATGIFTGIGAGTTTISYTIGTGCSSTIIVTVSSVTDVISGPSTVCVGSAITLTSSTGGSLWGSMSTSVATVTSGGVVTGVAAGTVTITHTPPAGCATAPATYVVTVTATPAPGAITGTTTLSVGATTALANSVTGGTWTSADPSVATISSSGVVSGVAAGTAMITYSVTGCSGVATATTIVTVTAASNCISGDVQFSGAPYYGGVKVWLIKYDPATLLLTACDSTYVSGAGATASYSFCGMGTDSFRVKAACDSAFTTTGYLPTYHNSSAYWHAATVINHVSGTSDINKHIAMASGIPTIGPGFIAGDVTTGANKGTTDFVPAVGMLVYCVNNVTGAILQQTKTDVSGHYSFSNLPVGEQMKIYPEHINYATTPYAPITLTSGAPSMTVADFQQHTVSMTITPKTTIIGNTTTNDAGVSVFPNPASGMLNVQWNVANAGTCIISIADVTGRTVLSATADMSQVSGNVSLDLNGISKGIYMVSIKANGVKYNNKIEIQ